jgi:hypothetical protein
LLGETNDLGVELEAVRGERATHERRLTWRFESLVDARPELMRGIPS